MSDPFKTNTDKAMVAIKGARCGYVQLAPAQDIQTYGELPTNVLAAAKDWACRLEMLGAKRVYWITLSEVVPRLHVHLYPRWTDEEPKGLVLFEAREKGLQPIWTEAVEQTLANWAAQQQVAVISPATY